MMKQLFLSLILLTTIAARDQPYGEQLQGVPQNTHMFTQTQLWFNQVVDHYDYRSQTFWKQRYWVIDNYFNPNAGPVFLFICGEYVCQGVPPARQWVVTLAERYQGLILVLEHRFYGSSLPFGNASYTLSNMKLLNSQQALSDLAYFLGEVKANKLHKVTEKSPWICVGGSYPGALSAWFRYKYPHLTIGAIASSAVVKAIEDYSDFDQQMYLSSIKSGDWCVKAINDTSSRVEALLKTADGPQFKAQFPGADKLTDQQFLFFWVDSSVELIQYGSRTKLCDGLKNKSPDDQFKYMTDNVVQNNQASDYGSYYLANETYAILDGQGARMWIYQSCTEFGFWQTYSRVHPMRPFSLNINFYKQFCMNSFGLPLWPYVDRKNIEYGGFNLQIDNLLMANGIEDPWRWASVQESKGTIISRVANCNNCAHCVDLYTPLTSDPAQLKTIRNQQFIAIRDWLQNYWRKTGSKHNVRFQ